MFIHVRGGNNNWKRVKQQVKSDWKCSNCDVTNRYYWRRCPNCHHPRKDSDGK